METAKEFLQNKGLKNVNQPSKRYNLTVAELVEFLDEYSTRVLKDFLKITNKKNRSSIFCSSPDQ